MTTLLEESSPIAALPHAQRIAEHMRPAHSRFLILTTVQCVTLPPKLSPCLWKKSGAPEVSTKLPSE